MYVLICVDVPSIGWASISTIGLATDVWVLVLVSEVEAEVVDDVSSILDHISSFLEVTLSSMAAEVLKLGHVIWVGGS